MRYLSRIPKTGFYKFQRGIPVELRHFFPGKGTTWREHLQTKDLPEARVKCLDVARRVEEAFQRARAKHQAEAENLVLPIPPVHELTVAVQFWREDQLYRRAEAVLSGYAEATVQFHRECRLTQAIERPSMAEAPADYLLRLEAEDAVLQGWIAEITLKEGWTLPEGHAARQVLWNMVRGAWLQVLQTEQKWRALDYSEMPVAPPPERRSNVAASAPSPTPLPTSSSLTLGEAYEAWAKAPVVHGARQREARTLIEGRLAVRRFKELHGDMALSAIQRTHARSYRDAISQLPAHLSKALNELPLPELLQRDLSAFQPRTATTINKSLNLLSAIASQAERNGHLDDTLGWKNPFDVQMEVNELYNESYEPFEKAELGPVD